MTAGAAGGGGPERGGGRLKERIAAEIARTGPVPFERFMEMALYDPRGGYYAAGPLRSREGGDFLTSPEVSPEFGAALARWAEEEHRRLGRPDDFSVVDAGAGSGSLLAPLLEALPFSPRAMAVEASPAALEAAASRLPRVELAGREGPSEPFRGVVTANELIDNLPAAAAVRRGGGWTELWVGAEGGGLVLVEAPVRPEVEAWLNSYAGGAPEGGAVECQLAAAAWLNRMIDLLEAGSILIIDYGGPAEDLLRRGEGTLRTYRSHRPGPHPLDAPGLVDITSDVNFTALRDTAERRGLDCRLTTQRRFLTEMGLAGRLEALRRRELELARTGPAMARLRVRSRVQGVEALLDPGGLGGFRVLAARR